MSFRGVTAHGDPSGTLQFFRLEVILGRHFSSVSPSQPARGQVGRAEPPERALHDKVHEASDWRRRRNCRRSIDGRGVQGDG